MPDPQPPRPIAPRLTDRATLRCQRARALALARADAHGQASAASPLMDARAFFLHRIAADEIKERLAEVNRVFTKPAIVSGWPELWGGVVPHATLARDEAVLALSPGAHDLVVHAMSLHWADDPVGQLVQCRHALRPDGLFLAVLPGGRSLAGLRACLAEAEAALSGGLSPRVLPMGEIRDLGALLQRAGFAMPVADSLSLDVSYSDAFALMRELRAMGEGNALAARHRRVPPRALFSRAAQLYAHHFPTTSGRVKAMFELIFLTGWSPAADQPQPLRPGSARARLADALDVPETPLPRRGDGSAD